MNARTALLLAGAGLVGAIGAVYVLTGDDTGSTTETGAALAAVTVPPLSGAAAEGAEIFSANCASCHGANAEGRAGRAAAGACDLRTGHHADGAFFLAVAQRVRQHHWTFGNMSPVAGVSPDEIARIVAYVRTLQRANGIE
ncbi:MAG: cytochrome c [Alphaproteobacteria bacterium]|nr:cytochrome c [Alphaproteobacteria bacterium]